MLLNADKGTGNNTGQEKLPDLSSLMSQLQNLIEF